MYTDPKRVRADIPGTVEGNPVFIYHDAFNPNVDEVNDLKERYRAGKVGDVEVKTKLGNALNAHLEPIRERRAALLAKPDTVREILHEGSARARKVAIETMERVRDAVRGPSGSLVPIDHVPHASAYGADFEDLGRRAPDVSRLRTLTGFAPSRTLDEIVADAVRWARTARIAAA